MPSLKEMKYEVPANLAKFVGPEVAQEQKLLAARGMVPLPPKDLVQVLYTLTRNPDEVVRQTAAKSLVKMPENILRNVAEDPNTSPFVLNFLARRLSPDSPLQEAIALNRATHDDTVVFQATLANKRVIDIISQNQIRILREPAIVDALADNILTGQAMLERIIKFVEMETRRSKKKKGAGEDMEVEVEEVEEEKAEEDEEDVAAVTMGADEDEVEAVTMEDSPWAKMTFSDELMRDHDVEDEDQEEELETNLFKRVQGMKVSEKIKLGLTGGQQARKLLIKDSNKMVASAVLKSPRITENEVEAISRNKSMNEEIVRMVAQNKEWTRSYHMKLNLVQNPKTPLPEAMRFMNYLRDKDLMDLSRSRSVPSQIKAQARRIIQRKQQKQKPGGKH